MIERQTWILLGLVAGLFLYILAFERDRPAPTQETVAPLFQMDAEQVRAVELRRGNQRVRIELQEGQWMITKPLLYPALRTRVAGLLEEAGRLPVVGRIPEPDDGGLDQYGLEPPAVKLRIEGRTANQELHLGSHTLVGGDNAYLRVPGRTGVFVIPAYFRDDLTLDPNRWRNPRLVHLNPGQRQRVNRIQAAKGDQIFFSLELNATTSTWKLTQPAPAKRADTDRVRQFFDTAQGWRVTRYFPPNAATDLQSMELLGAPLGLEFSENTNRLAKVQFGSVYTNNLIYARDLVFDNVMAITGSNTAEKLRQPPWQLFGDRRLVNAFEDSQVARLEIREGVENTTILARSSNSTEWRIESPIATRADSKIVTELLASLRSLEASSLVHDNTEELAQYQLDQPIATFTLLQRKAPGAVTNAVISRLSIGKDNEQSGTFIRRHDEPKMVYATANTWRERLRTRFFRLRDRQVFNTPLENILKVTLQSGDAITEYARNAQQVWNGPDGPLDANASDSMDTALRALGELHAVDWVERGSDKADEATYGFEQADRKVTLHLRGDEKPRILIFGKPNDEGYRFTMGQALPDTEFVIFLFPKDTYALLAQVLDLPR